MKSVSHWVPAAFCGFLSLIAMTMQVVSDSDAWKPAFYCFLPMCFFYVGLLTTQMHREIRDLRSQLAAIQQRHPD